MSTVKILNYQVIFSFAQERMGKKDVIVNYSVDGVRQYSTSMPAEDYTPEKAIEQITAEEKERLKLIGKTFEVSA